MVLPTTKGHPVNVRQKARRGKVHARAAKRSERTPEQQLKELDRRLGKGKGATRERARLAGS